MSSLFAHPESYHIFLSILGSADITLNEEIWSGWITYGSRNYQIDLIRPVIIRTINACQTKMAYTGNMLGKKTNHIKRCEEVKGWLRVGSKGWWNHRIVVRKIELIDALVEQRTLTTLCTSFEVEGKNQYLIWDGNCRSASKDLSNAFLRHYFCDSFQCTIWAKREISSKRMIWYGFWSLRPFAIKNSVNRHSNLFLL